MLRQAFLLFNQRTITTWTWSRSVYPHELIYSTVNGTDSTGIYIRELLSSLNKGITNITKASSEQDQPCTVPVTLKFRLGGIQVLEVK